MHAFRLAAALQHEGLAFIAEIKRRSPSAGDLRPQADAAALARSLTAGGARALSVLVDERFAGSLADLQAVRPVTSLPLLAKGFFATPAELDAVHAAGADAALLLLRDLDDGTCRQLLAHAAGLGLDILLEAHDAVELARALALPAVLVGINARDLNTFAIDRATQLDLVTRAAAYGDRIVIAESGIATRAQAALAELAGAQAVLVGTTLMRAVDPEATLRELQARPLVKICGLTRQADVDLAVAAGADLCGFIFADSPRRASSLLDVPAGVLRVAVFVGPLEQLDDYWRMAAGADLLQVYAPAPGQVRGREAVLLYQDAAVAQVLDLPWEQADDQHWAQARARSGRTMLAGRLGPDNVAAAIATVRPWAVDAASRLETVPGQKDPELVRAFVAAARAASF